MVTKRVGGSNGRQGQETLRAWANLQAFAKFSKPFLDTVLLRQGHGLRPSARVHVKFSTVTSRFDRRLIQGCDDGPPHRAEHRGLTALIHAGLESAKRARVYDFACFKRGLGFVAFQVITAGCA